MAVGARSMGAVGGNRGRRPIELKEEEVRRWLVIGRGEEGSWFPVLAHPAHGRGGYPLAKIIAMGSGSNKFCLEVLGA